jgi:hypothetical protein
VNGTVACAKKSARPLVKNSVDAGNNGKGDLFRRFGADIKSDRGIETSRTLVAENTALVAQSGQQEIPLRFWTEDSKVLQRRWEEMLGDCGIGGKVVCHDNGDGMRWNGMVLILLTLKGRRCHWVLSHKTEGTTGVTPPD